MSRWLSLALIAVAANLTAQEPPKLLMRYNVEFNPINYPQKTPQDAMKSIAKALDGGRYDYLLAQLTDPKYIDPRVEEYRRLLFPAADLQAEVDDIARELDEKKRNAKILEKQRKDRARVVAAFNRLIVETRKHLDEDPVLLKELRLLAKSGDWEIDDDRAIGTIKNVSPRRIVLRKREDRWFMEERYQ